MVWLRRCCNGHTDQQRQSESDFCYTSRQHEARQVYAWRMFLSAWPEAPPALWPPTDTETARLTLWRALRANFTTSAQVAQESVSEWPVPDLQPIWRVHRAPLHLCIPHERNAAVLFNTTALLNPAGSLGWRWKSRRARKQLKTGTFTHSLCWGGFLWCFCPGRLVFTWNCEGTKDLRTKMAAAQDSSNIFLKTQQSFKTFFFF